MDIKCIKVGLLETNCYMLSNNKKTIIIDPGDEAEKIDSYLGSNHLIGIIITHNHFDHIGALDYFKNKYNVPVFDYNNLKEGKNKIDTFEFEVIYTKGHTDDSITIYFKEEKIMFVGDFIFFHSIGRTDLETGSMKKMKKSIQNIKKYDNIIMYPGHGVKTSIKEEKENNKYF